MVLHDGSNDMLTARQLQASRRAHQYGASVGWGGAAEGVPRRLTRRPQIQPGGSFFWRRSAELARGWGRKAPLRVWGIKKGRHLPPLLTFSA